MCIYLARRLGGDFGLVGDLGLVLDGERLFKVFGLGLRFVVDDGLLARLLLAAGVLAPTLRLPTGLLGLFCMNVSG